ncbi:hypothetical protein HYFRA_00004365 [Hymenoscyphus fraxineus]|uniref:Uncharacterized protein n=1 Tax=Hymenoscyphus fraxineus TaxID=746836 RepID=A0A9N9PKL0_9HELO|nr:hypothetical protein HYFRA_00004365 [Hymenoscyphus fraxineus]
MLIPNVFVAAAVLSTFVASLPFAPSELSERSGTIDPVALERIKAKLNAHKWTLPRPHPRPNKKLKMDPASRPPRPPAPAPRPPPSKRGLVAKRSTPNPKPIDPAALARLKEKLNWESWAFVGRPFKNKKPEPVPWTLPPPRRPGLKRGLVEKRIAPIAPIAPIDLAAVARLKEKLNKGTWAYMPKSPVRQPKPRVGEPMLTYGFDYGQKTSSGYTRFYRAKPNTRPTNARKSKRGLGVGKLPKKRVSLESATPKKPAPEVVQARTPSLRQQVSSKNEEPAHAYRKTPMPVGTNPEHYPQTSRDSQIHPSVPEEATKKSAGAPILENRAATPNPGTGYIAMLKNGPKFRGQALRLKPGNSKIGPFMGRTKLAKAKPN